MENREELATYIRQGQAQERLLQQTNIHGKNNQLINEIRKKIKKARKKLKN
ncbi:MAG: hypothetical protein KGZ75_04580 [Syntrophomonadaceae bacterium]|nr:hypothetical protein [Syntrophomonadaceae bacterium]